MRPPPLGACDQSAQTLAETDEIAADKFSDLAWKTTAIVPGDGA